MTHAPESDDALSLSLGDPAVVAQLVRGFIAGVCERVAAVGAGAMTRDTAVRADRQACRDAADVFLGRNPAYEPAGHWNCGGLVDWMLHALRHVYESPDDPEARVLIVADVFAWGARFAYEAISAHEDDADETDLQDDLTNLADDLARFLLGVPGHFEHRAFE
jgi:hypothetical protein